MIHILGLLFMGAIVFLADVLATLPRGSRTGRDTSSVPYVSQNFSSGELVSTL